MKIGLISDTHGHLHPDVFEIFENADVIFHAGDIIDDGIITELEAIAPVHAVLGNCDMMFPGIPNLKVVELPFGNVVLTHSHLVPDRERNSEGLASHFKNQKPRLIVYGHTHIQKCEKVGECWVVNPGPAGKPRFRDKPSVMTAIWHESSDKLEYDVHLLEWKRN